MTRLISNLRLRVARALVPKGFTTPSASAFLSGLDMEDRGGAEISDPFLQSVWVYACVNAIGENVANVPLRLSRSGSQDEEVIETGPLFELLEQPNPDTTKFDFWETLVSWLMLRGTAYVVGTSKAGQVVRLRNRFRAELPPAQLHILASDRIRRNMRAGRVESYTFHAGHEDPTGSLLLLPEELLIFRLPNPYSHYDGLPPVGIAALAAGTDYAAAKFMRGLMLNNADQGMVVSSEQWLNDDQRKQIAAAMRERKRAAGTADRPLILGGGLKPEKPTISVADLQFLENRKFTRQEICAVLRVPQEILGYTEDANRSVADAARLNFVENRVAPLCARLAAALQPLCTSLEGGAVPWFDVDALPVMAAARRSRVDTAVKLFGIGVPLNDIVGNLDLGFEEYPWGDTAFLPAGFQSVENATAPLPDPAAPPAPAEPSSAPGPIKEPAKSGNPFERLAAVLAQQREQQRLTPNGYARAIAGSVKAKAGKLSRYFFLQRSRILARMGDANPEKSFAATRNLDGLWDEAAENEALKKLLRPSLLADLEFGGAQLWREIGLEDDFKVPPAEAIEFLRAREPRIEDINSATWERLRGSISEGLTNGDTMQELADRVRSVYGGSQQRAETIALTETNTAVNNGRLAGMREAGVEKKAWLASNLANSRPAHQRAGREYADGIPIDQAFRVDGEDLDCPGDLKGSPGNTINCKCTLLAIVGDKALKSDAPLTWEDWLASKRQNAASEAPVGSPDTREAGKSNCNGFPANCKGSTSEAPTQKDTPA